MIGVDEVGRGAWAGPLLVVAARQHKPLPHGVADSKILTRLRREILYDELKKVCDFGEGWVMPAEIDQLGLGEAMRLGTARALHALGADKSDKIVMDGSVNYCGVDFYRSSAVIDADALFPVVSAASIYAKVLRDSYMMQLPPRYKAYAFDRHVGYGTKLHIERLRQYGVSDIHRRSYAPIKKLLRLSRENQNEEHY